MGEWTDGNAWNIEAALAGDATLRRHVDGLQDRIATLEAELAEVTADKDYYVNFCAATSLCEGCQKKREERAIIATPRIQVEEDRDSLRQQLAEAKKLLLARALHISNAEAQIHGLEKRVCAGIDQLAEREAEILELRKRKPLVGSHDVERFYPGDDNAALNDEEKG